MAATRRSPRIAACCALLIGSSAIVFACDASIQVRPSAIATSVPSVVRATSTVDASGPPPSPAPGIGSPVPSPAVPMPSATPATVSRHLVVRARVLSGRLNSAIARAGAATVAGRIYVIGGLSANGSSSNVVQILDPSSGSAAAVGRLPAPVHDLAVAAFPDRAVAIGGGGAAPTNSVVAVDLAGRAKLVGRLPRPRADLGAASVANRIVIVGGGTNGVPDASVLETTDGVSFRRIATLVLPVRYPAVAELAGNVYVFGGMTADGRDTSAVQRIDPLHGTVAIVGHMPAPLSHAAALVIGDTLLVMGGERAGVTRAEIWQWNASRNAAQRAGSLPHPVSDAASTVRDGIGYLIGGVTSNSVLRTTIAVTTS